MADKMGWQASWRDKGRAPEMEFLGYSLAGLMQVKAKFTEDEGRLKDGRRFPHRRKASVWKPTPT